MEYIEMPECKELKRVKKYKEAADKLMYEIAVNLMMVHNKYSDVKYDSYKMCSILDYGKDSKRKLIEDLRDFRKIANILSELKVEFYYEIQNKKNDDYKQLLKEIEKLKRELKKKI